MKILLVCAGGWSTSFLMTKMKQYAASIGEQVEIKAIGFASADEYAGEYDVCLVAPQAAFQVDQIREDAKCPTAVIEKDDYGRANGENVIKLAHQTLGK